MRPSPTPSSATASCARTCTPAASAISAWWSGRPCSRLRNAPSGGGVLLAAAVAGYEAGGQIGRALMTARSRPPLPADRPGRPARRRRRGVPAVGLDEAPRPRDRHRRQHLVRLQPVAAYRRQRDVLPPGLRGAQCRDRGRAGRSRRLASENILEGEAGLFAAFAASLEPDRALFTGRQRDPRGLQQAGSGLQLRPDACQAALRARARLGDRTDAIAPIVVRVPRSGAALPGLRLQRTVRAGAAGQDEHPVRRGGSARARRGRRVELRRLDDPRCCAWSIWTGSRRARA